jgi:putative flavoprotein involved in K+ transport
VATVAAPNRHEVAVIGAGPAGLAAAATLGREGIDTVVLEQAGAVGTSWLSHYDRLHLHTVRWLSGLPGFAIPRSYGRWVARDDVQRYLQRYAQHHRLRVQLDTPVTALQRENGGWRLTTGAGIIEATTVVIATGYNKASALPDWPGKGSFRGTLLHASQYRNPTAYVDRDVLVVGPGNSGAEIAHDLAEGGAARVWLAVRQPPNIVRRATLGVPSQLLGIAMRRLPSRFVDRAALVTQRVSLGDLSDYGLAFPTTGVASRLRDDGRIPVLDVGLVRSIKGGRVHVVGPVTGFDGADVVLGDGKRLQPDVVIAATGYRRALEPLVGDLGVLLPDGRPKVNGATTLADAPGLYFIGYSNPFSGNLRELGIDARRIAKAIAAARRPEPSR